MSAIVTGKLECRRLLDASYDVDVVGPAAQRLAGSPQLALIY
jgi:hypothetical protein